MRVVLELPKELGPVQEAMNIEEEASYVIAIKNPEIPAPPEAGLTGPQEVEYPKALQEKFEGKRFIPPNPSLLDYEGAELILISAAEDVQPILDSNSTRSMSPADRRQSSKTCAWRRAHIHLSRYSVAKWARQSARRMHDKEGNEEDGSL